MCLFVYVCVCVCVCVCVWLHITCVRLLPILVRKFNKVWYLRWPQSTHQIHYQECQIIYWVITEARRREIKWIIVRKCSKVKYILKFEETIKSNLGEGFEIYWVNWFLLPLKEVQSIYTGIQIQINCFVKYSVWLVNIYFL